MTTHFSRYPDDDGPEQAPCGVWIGDASDLSSDWSLVDCKRCRKWKDTIMATHEAEERAIVQQMGDMAKFMKREAGEEMTNIPRYNAPRGTTLCEAVGGELVMAAEHAEVIDALRTQIAELRAENEAMGAGLLDPESVLANMLRGTIAKLSPRGICKVYGQVLNVEDAQHVEISRLRAELEAARGFLAKAQLHLQASGHNLAADDIGRHLAETATPGPKVQAEQREAVHWRAVLSPAEVPMQLNIHEHVAGFTDRRKAEDWIAARLQMDGWHYTLEALYPGPQPSQVSRIPAGLYAELEALRTLRDATGVYLQGYMRDEIEDEDSCVTEDQHDAACSVKSALYNARALEWKGGDK
ncbi:hypothetical protein [Ectopseudomonas khazarica]|uniref:hypothetical protein n=1 Tax=Ectopseudomonas khazarica TaxID=2502979 RepID=UPI003B9555F6